MDFQSRIRKEFARQAETLSVAAAFTDADVLDRIRAAIGPTKTMGILDVGCGPGILAAALAPLVREVVGFDLTPEMLDKARQRCQEAGLQNVRFERGRAEALPFPAEGFDAVVSRATLHHFPDPLAAAREMVRVVRPNGKLVLADIVSSENTEEADLHNALEVLRDPTHVRMLTASEIQTLIEAAGLRVTATSTWEMRRDFDEWIRITNTPERATPLFTVMRTLAKAGIDAGIDLGFNGQTVVFKHRWLVITAEKNSQRS
jgi:ubiquinone/menaquinone biosynthesis C-methylase UbiE